MAKQINLGKPSGITLQDHTLHVMEQVIFVLPEGSFLEKKYKQFADADLREELLQAAKYHDWGKAHPAWQSACQKDNVLYKLWRISKGYKPDEINANQHRIYEQEMHQKSKIAAPNLMRSGLRHEFASINFLDKKNIQTSNIVKAAIAAHHSKLGFRFGETRWRNDAKGDLDEFGPFYKYWEYFKRLSFQVKKLSTKQLILERYRYSAVRTLLQLADTRASRLEGEGEEASYEFKKFNLNKKDWELRPVQKAAIEIANQPIAILRAPTGSGKTYAALLWANEQINGEKPKADRLVIAMPTRFTSNALSISVAEEIDETGLYHSSAWYNRYGELTDKEAKKKAREAHRMARFLATPVSVCTIDHLLISLTGTKEQHHSTFFFLANSAVVFDEADFYDPFVQANIVELLKVLRILQVPVLIMSATVPDSARELYGIDFPIKSPKHQVSKNIKYLKWLKTEEDKDAILEKMLEEGTGIIYANTIARALTYYQEIVEEATKREVPLVIYHSRFTEPDKKNIEERLIGILGKTAWENQEIIPIKGIAIMTQIGEMSVNISSPNMLSDLCPWDRLAQRIGRLVRFEMDSTQEGTCYVVQPMKEGALYPAPYGEYDRKQNGWIALDSLLNTQRQLKQKYSIAKKIKPKQLEKFVNKLYPSAPEILGQAAFNQRNYRQLIKDNWLLLPDKYTDEEGGQVGEDWSSRHIPPQQSILIELKTEFTSYADFQEHILEFGVSCPIYLIEKEMRKPIDQRNIGQYEIKIGKSDDVQIIYFTESYDPDLGLAFLYGFQGNAQKQLL